MRRPFLFLPVLATALLIACQDDPVSTPATGGIAFDIAMVTASPSGPSPVVGTSGPAASSHSTPLDSGRIVLSGPTSRTVSATPGTSVTISGLQVGTYSAILQGFVADEMTFRGQVTNISVEGGQTNSVAQVLFIPTNLEFGALGETIQLEGAPSGVQWISSDENIVTVDASGLLTSVANGTADITGSVGSTTGQAVAEVHQNTATVQVTPADPSIAAGATQQFTATALDSLGNPVAGVQVLWVSSNPNVAVIDQNGLATGIAGGTTSVAAAADGGVGFTSLTVTGGGTPARVAFATEPSGQSGYDPIPAIVVEIRDANNQLITDATNDVEIRVRDSPNATPPNLDGTTVVAAVGGVATFSDLRIDQLGNGFSLEASIGLPAAVDGPAGVPGSQITAVSQDFNARLQAQSVATGGIYWGGDFTCALSTTGHAFCWGYNADFTLARASDGNEDPVPGVVKNAPAFIQVTAGGRHACGLTSVADGGEIYCWGSNSDGQLGGGTGIGTDAQRVPVKVLGANVFAEVSAGGLHTCAVTTGGQTFCWGQASAGQVGAGAGVTADQFAPVQVTGGQTMTSIAAGAFHTCAINLSQVAFCWGEEADGRLGISPLPAGNVFDPTQVTGSAIAFESISAGYYHTCGRSTSEIYCWGDFGQNKLGPAPVADILQPSDNLINRGSFGTFDGIDAGGQQHTCGVTASETVCWGYNANGQTGVGNDNSPVSALTAITGTQVLQQVDGGYSHTCGVTSNGEVYCWGANFYGQLGTGDDQPSEIHDPTLVPGTGS